MTKSYQTIWLHSEVPSKPTLGMPCNGCGVCCAITPCPLARLRFMRFWRPLPTISRCPALQWMDEKKRYECGLLVAPTIFWSKIPAKWHRRWQSLVARWIASGIGCDCTTEIDLPSHKP